MNILKTLQRKLRIKISIMREKRRRRNISVYPRIVPQHLSQIDLGEELTLAALQEPLPTVPSLTALQEPPPTVPSLTALQEPPPTVPSLTALQEPPPTVPSLTALQEPPPTVPSLTALQEPPPTVPSLTALQEPPPTVPSLTALHSNFNNVDFEQESPEELLVEEESQSLTRSSSLTSLGSDETKEEVPLGNR